MHTFTRALLGAAVALVAVPTIASAQATQTGMTVDANYTVSSAQSTNIRDINQSVPLMDTVWYEDFDNGLDDWTNQAVTPDTLIWKARTAPLVGGFYGGTREMESPTADNGYVIINYDNFYGGDTLEFGENGPVVPVNQAIISPQIDLSAAGSGLVVEMYSYFRYCCTAAENAAFVSFSGDGGATFQNEVTMTTDAVVDVNDDNPGSFRINIPAQYEGSSQFHIRLRFAGSYYFWAVDDILITSRPPVDATITSFYASAANASTPVTEVSAYPLAFVADVQNNGGVDQGFTLYVDVLEAGTGGALLYTDTIRYANVESDSTFQNETFADVFPMPTEVGSYVGRYTIVSDQPDADANLADNVRTFNFSVSPNTFSRTGAFNISGTRPSATDEEYGSASIFLTPSVATTDVNITSVTWTALARDFTANDNAFVELNTYGWYGDLDGDSQVDRIPNTDSTELVLLGTREYTVDASWGDTTITDTPVEDGSVVLPTGEDFIGFVVQIDYFPGAGSGNADNRFFTGVVAPPNGGNGAYTLATDSIGEPVQLYILKVPSRDELDSYFYFTGSVPAINATINVVSSVNEISAEEVTLRPNPATDLVQLDLDLPVASEGAATMTIVDAIGKTVRTEQLDIATQQILNVNTSDLRSGLYYLNLTTKDGRSATRKFLIQR